MIANNVAHLLNKDIETMTYSQTKRQISTIIIETWKEIYHGKEKRWNEYLEQRQQQLHEASERGTKNNRKRQVKLTQYLKNNLLNVNINLVNCIAK